MYFYIIFINVTIKSSLDATGLRVKVDNNFCVIRISHEELVYTLREKGRLYGRGAGTRIYVVARLQFFLLLGVDDINFASPDDKF